MSPNSSIIAYPWVTLGAIWLAAAAGKKPTIRRQPLPGRFLTFAVLLLGFAMNAGPYFNFGWLGARFVPYGNASFYTGFAITVLGCAFAVWARLTLGGNWSGRPSLMLGHELITKGPYALARHPIYTGLLMATAGTALALGEWRNLLGALFVLAGLLFKMRDEEKIMLDAFPAAYPAYRRRVKALVPGVF